METSASPSQPLKPLSSWSVDDVCSWIKGLDQSLQIHTPQFLAHCICGEDLVKMDRQKLEYLQVTQIGHQELLMEAVELLVSRDSTVHQQTVVRRARLLSKKASQLIQLTCRAYPESKVYSQSLEKAASVMEAARGIISWLDSNPCSLVDDYESFRESILKASLNINSAVSKEPDQCREILLNSGNTMVKLTSMLITPQHFNAVTDVAVIIDVTLKPDRNGLGFSLCKQLQGPLQVNRITPEGPADRSGRVFVGDEVLQVNGQNVLLTLHRTRSTNEYEKVFIVCSWWNPLLSSFSVAWEVPNVVESLKSNPYEVTLTIKRNMSQTPPTGRKNSNNSCDVGKSPQQSHISSAQMRHNVVSNASKRHSTPIHSMIAKEAVPSFETNGHLPLRNTVSAPSKHSLTAEQSGIGSALTDVHNGEEEAVDGARNGTVAAQMKKIGSGAASVELGMLGRNPTPVSVASQSSEELPVFTGQGGSDSSSRTDTPDEGESGESQEERAASVPPKDRSATETKRLPPRTTNSASNVAMAVLGEKSKAQSSSTGDLPSTCYRTQVIGGVVHKIPITPQATPPASPPSSRKTYSEQVFKTVVVGGVVMKIPVEKTGKSTEDVKTAGGPTRMWSSKRKNAVQKQEQSPSPKSIDRESDNNSPNPEDEVSAHKGVFSNPKEVTISGHSTKEVEVQSQLESISRTRPDKKQDVPELMVPCFQLKDIDHDGWLQKLGGSGLTPKNWRRRWFVLKGPHLYYYKTAFDVCALGLVKLRGYTVEETADSKKQFAFQLSKEGERTYYFIAETSEGMTRWMQVLKKVSEL